MLPTSFAGAAIGGALGDLAGRDPGQQHSKE
jgi:hypothetical protein